jgi:hypothetical protein
MAYAWGTTGAPRGQQVTILAQDAVIVRLLGGVGENLVRLTQRGELVRVASFVGVQQHGELPKAGSDLIGLCIAAYTQHCIPVVFRASHISSDCHCPAGGVAALPVV